LRVEPPVVIISLRQLLPRGNERHRSRTFAADLFKHGVVVARADAQIAGDDFAFAFFRQNAAEKSPAFLRWKTLLAQRQGLRQGRCTWSCKPALEIFKGHLAVVILDEMADQLLMEIDKGQIQHYVTAREYLLSQAF